MERLREREFLAAIVDSSDDAVIGKDLDGTILTWNRGAEAMYGYGTAEAVGRNVNLLIPPGQADELPAILERIKAGRRIDHYETVRQAKNGRYLEISLSVSPVHDDAGRVVAAATIARDITQRKRTERSLLDANEAMRRALAVRDRFLHLMSHELRTPLNPILGYAGALLMGLAGPLSEEQRRQLTVLQSGANRLLYLVDALLELVEVETGSLVAHLERADARELARKAAARLKMDADERECRIELDLPDSECVVETNPEIVSKVLSRLGTNALDHGKAAVVTISVESSGGARSERVRIAVTDDGVGMAPARVAKFLTGLEWQDSAEELVGGAGFGLYLSRKQLAAIGGSLDISAAERRGTRVVITLPAIPLPSRPSTVG
jgi:PAS domain S-box-containing protein